MITIQNGKDIRVVSNGLYEDLFKGMGFTPIEDEKEVKEVKVVTEVETKVEEPEVQEPVEHKVEFEKSQPKKHK